MPDSARDLRHWHLDPDDPRAPTEAEWAMMTPEERASVVAALPSEFEPCEAMPPEGDFHDEEASRWKRGLRRFFGGSGRRVYIAGDLPVYYPGERMFAPDLIAVVDADPHPRLSWVVNAEGKGLDVAMEIVWAGSRRKDLVENVQRYAHLRIPEYFVFDLPRQQLFGYRLVNGSYRSLETRAGRLACRELGLELGLERDRVRFYSSTAAIPDLDEVIVQLENTVDQAVGRTADLERQLDEERRALEDERRAHEEERRAREEAEQKLKEALARVEALEKRSR